MSVLIISQDWAIQNMVEQVCLTCGYQSIAARTIQEAEARLAQPGPKGVTLMVIDTSILGEGGADLQVEASHLILNWTGQYSGLSLVFIGTALQKYAILAAYPTPVPFVTMPFSPHDLMRTVQPFLPASGRLPPLSSIQMRLPDQMRGGSSIPEPPPGILPPCGL